MQQHGANPSTQSPAPCDHLDVQPSGRIHPSVPPFFGTLGFYEPFIFECHMSTAQDAQRQLTPSVVVNGTDEAFNPFEFVDFTADEMHSVFEVINLFNGEASSGVEGMSHEVITILLIMLQWWLLTTFRKSSKQILESQLMPPWDNCQVFYNCC